MRMARYTMLILLALAAASSAMVIPVSPDRAMQNWKDAVSYADLVVEGTIFDIALEEYRQDQIELAMVAYRGLITDRTVRLTVVTLGELSTRKGTYSEQTVRVAIPTYMMARRASYSEGDRMLFALNFNPVAGLYYCQSEAGEWVARDGAWSSNQITSEPVTVSAETIGNTIQQRIPVKTHATEVQVEHTELTRNKHGYRVVRVRAVSSSTQEPVTFDIRTNDPRVRVPAPVINLRRGTTLIVATNYEKLTGSTITIKDACTSVFRLEREEAFNLSGHPLRVSAKEVRKRLVEVTP